MATTERRTQSERRSASRSALLEAALDSLVDNGLSGFTTADVCRRAGLSQGALFKHFPTKSGLLAATIEHLAGRLAGARRGLILAGPDDDPALPAALARLAGATGFPIVADPLSQVRTGPHDRSMVVVRGDQLARPGPWLDTHLPDLVLRTGAMPTSAPLATLLARARPELYVLDGDDG